MPVFSVFLVFQGSGAAAPPEDSSTNLCVFPLGRVFPRAGDDGMRMSSTVGIPCARFHHADG